MATSLVGPFLEDMASPAAPVPRPPQPTRASWIVLLSPAWTCGSTIPARAEAATTVPDCRIRSRRDGPSCVGLLIINSPLLGKHLGCRTDTGRVQPWGHTEGPNRFFPV